MYKFLHINNTVLFLSALIILFTTSSYVEASVSCNKKLVEDGFSFFEVTEKKGNGKIYAYTKGICFKPDHYEKSYGNFRQISKKDYCIRYNNNYYGKVDFKMTSLRANSSPCRANSGELKTFTSKEMQSYEEKFEERKKELAIKKNQQKIAELERASKTNTMADINWKNASDLQVCLGYHRDNILASFAEYRFRSKYDNLKCGSMSEMIAAEQKIRRDQELIEEKKLAEKQRLAEEKRLAEKERLAEEKRVADEQRLIEEEQLAKELEMVAAEERFIELTSLEDKFGFTCEWIKWNTKGTPEYIECLDNQKYLEAEKLRIAEQERLEKLRIAEQLRLEEIKAQERAAKEVEEKRLEEEERLKIQRELEKQIAQLELKYGVKCQAFGFKKEDDGYPNCMMTMMQEEEKAEQVRIENEIRLAEIELRLAEAEAKNKLLESEIARQQASEQVAMEAARQAQRAAEEQQRQANAIMQKQLEVEKRKAKQQEMQYWSDMFQQGYDMMYPAPKQSNSIDCYTWGNSTTCNY